MKLKKLLFILCLVSLFSCETDDSIDIQITEADLIGIWNVKEQTIENGSIVFTENNQTFTASYSAFSKNINMTMTFSDNPKKVISEGSYTMVATASFAGQTNTEEEFIQVEDDPDFSPTWSLNGNNLTISDDGDLPTNLIIENYDGNTLKLKATLDETETDGGNTVTIKATFYIVLEK